MAYVCLILVLIFNAFERMGWFEYSDIALQLITISAMYTAFRYTRHSNVMEKSTWFLLLFSSVINITVFYWEFLPCNYEILVYSGELFLFICMAIYYAFRRFKLESDEYDKGKNYIIIKKPNHIMNFVYCLFTPLVGGFALLSGGRVGWYSKSDSRYLVSKIDNTFIDLRKFKLVEINLSDNTINSHFESYIDTDFSQFKNNCFNTILYLFPEYKALIKTPYGLINYLTKKRDDDARLCK